ncbi:MAG: hypothetical protein PHV90_10645, partial [Smithella sp.]|nr:hypothetical protein [Smithella sp.]
WVMRDFNDKDRKKKRSRISLEENPANLSADTLSLLESATSAALKDSYLRCPVAWKIARELNVPRIAVGAMMDKLGARVTECQIGFFKVEKTPYAGTAPREPSPELASSLRELDAADKLTCSAIFEMARQFKTTPLKISEAANILGLKIRKCQLGCF